MVYKVGTNLDSLLKVRFCIKPVVQHAINRYHRSPVCSKIIENIISVSNFFLVCGLKLKYGIKNEWYTCTICRWQFQDSKTQFSSVSFAVVLMIILLFNSFYTWLFESTLKGKEILRSTMNSEGLKAFVVLSMGKFSTVTKKSGRKLIIFS